MPVSGPLMSVPMPVRDLYYGDALFYFFQDDYFQSLIHLDAAISLGRVANHQTEAELLKGALYLSLGQHVEAGRVFQSLLNNNVDESVSDRAWFYLAKIWYQRGYWSESEHALRSIRAENIGDMEAERQSLLAQVLMQQERYEEASSLLQQMELKKKDSSWLAYAQYNLGVALMRQGKTDSAVLILNKLGTILSDSEELLALRDKANLAVGLVWIKSGRIDEAEQALQRVRLNGPFSSKALLGLGWAQSIAGKYNEALVPLEELRQRSLLDSAVQESYLAIPSAYAHLGAEKEASDFYKTAIDSFQLEIKNVDESIESIRNGTFLKAVLEGAHSDQSGWGWQLSTVPDAPESRYLYDLMASNSFKEALRNYQDLQLMRRNLLNWTQSVEAFQDMVDTRKLAFDQRTEKVNKYIDGVDLAALEEKTIDLETRVNAIARDEDVVSLGTTDEQSAWRRVNQLDTVLNSADSGDAAVMEMKNKVNLLRGVLYWNMSSSFKARLWTEQKQVRELTVATKEARRRHTLLDRTMEQVPQRTERYSERVEEMAPRLQAMLARCKESDEAQRNLLERLAIAQLEEQKLRLSQYALQAQFALASIYDHAAVTDGELSAQPEGAGQ